MGRTNKDTVKLLFRGLQANLANIPDFSRLSKSDQRIFAEVSSLVMKGLSMVADGNDFNDMFGSQRVGLIKCAYFALCRMRLRHQLSLLDEQWGEVLGDIDTARQVFMDFDKMMQTRRNALAMLQKTEDYGDDAKEKNFNELWELVCQLSNMKETLARGMGDFEKAKKGKASLLQRWQFWAVVISGLILASSIVFGILNYRKAEGPAQQKHRTLQNASESITNAQKVVSGNLPSCSAKQLNMDVVGHPD